MSKIVTEQMLRDMVDRAYRKLRIDPDSFPCGQIEDELYIHGQFKNLIGAVIPPKTRKKK